MSIQWWAEPTLRGYKLPELRLFYPVGHNSQTLLLFVARFKLHMSSLAFFKRDSWRETRAVIYWGEDGVRMREKEWWAEPTLRYYGAVRRVLDFYS